MRYQGDAQFVETAKQVEVDAGDEAVFEFGIGEAVPLSEQDGFEHGQQGIGRTAAVVSKVTGSLTIQVLFDRLPINHLNRQRTRYVRDHRCRLPDRLLPNAAGGFVRCCSGLRYAVGCVCAGSGVWLSI